MNTPTQEATKWLLIQWQSLPRIVIRSFIENFDSSKISVVRKFLIPRKSRWLENSIYRKFGWSRIACRKLRQLQQQQLSQQRQQQQPARQQHRQLALHRLQRWRNLLQLRKSQSAMRIQRKRTIENRFKPEQLRLDHLLWVFLQCVRSDTLKEQKMKLAKTQQNGEMTLLSKFLWWLTTLKKFSQKKTKMELFTSKFKNFVEFFNLRKIQWLHKPTLTVLFSNILLKIWKNEQNLSILVWKRSILRPSVTWLVDGWTVIWLAVYQSLLSIFDSRILYRA